MRHVMSAILFFFFFNDTATTEIYTLSLHDALPISRGAGVDAATTQLTARLQQTSHPGCRDRCQGTSPAKRNRVDSLDLVTIAGAACAQNAALRVKR